jgi:TRAP-type C4-dicarboxylate transport system permease small subunit
VKALLFRGSQSFAWFGGFTIVVLIAITFVTVVGRHSPVAGAWLTGGYELSELLMGILAISAWAYCWYRGGHIRIELIRQHLSTRGRAIVDAIASFFGLVFVGFASWAMIETTILNLKWDVGTPLVKVPIGPFQIVFALFLVHFAAVLFGSLFGFIAKAFGHEGQNNRRHG